MKKIFLITSIFMAIGGLFASCEKNTNTEQPNCSSITIDFCLDDDEGQTKSSSTASLSLDNGCTIAFYSQSNGALLATGSCEGSSRKIILTSVPEENCNVYCVGNTTFSWPSSESSLTTQSIAIDVTKGSIPRSTLVGDYTWTVGTSTIRIEHMPIMYVPLRIKRDLPENVSFVAESARISSCPNVIYPFNSTSTGTSGEQDEATDTDIDIFNEDDYFVLYVPSNGETKVYLEGTRHTGNGINYTDTYTLTVPALDRENNQNSQTIKVNGENTGNQVVIIIGTDDTRSFVFGTNELEVKGDEQIYSTYVKGRAGNYDTDWTYSLSWTGDAALSGTQIRINGEEWLPLSSAGRVDNINGDANEKTIEIKSSYSGSSEKYVTLTASVDNISKQMTVTVNPAEEENTYINFYYEMKSGMCSDVLESYSENLEDYWTYNEDGSYIQSNGWNEMGVELYPEINQSFYIILSGTDKSKFYVGYNSTDGGPNNLLSTSTYRSTVMDANTSVFIYPKYSNYTANDYIATLTYYSASTNEAIKTIEITHNCDKTIYELTLLLKNWNFSGDTFWNLTTSENNDEIYFGEDSEPWDNDKIVCYNQYIDYKGQTTYYNGKKFKFRASRALWEKCSTLYITYNNLSVDNGYTFEEAKNEIDDWLGRDTFTYSPYTSNCNFQVNTDASGIYVSHNGGTSLSTFKVEVSVNYLLNLTENMEVTFTALYNE